ncbi:glycosyl transferase, family 2 [Richelia sinica FACHB-800]|uniref:Glycosyl transferase, family 2 n=1 Tax=Richelia sinica FACHB-800 TaxID=1357546 RepID=A0A975T4Q9_9NOST|nr:glycosyltransferase family 2 protein [Richelia sinica]MBD2663059.1 glycosyltransferase family 2 protein [Richelia sinica FACHB-800]QXE21920.1 glycosyl transferase, family 2 [Richelia sinica FACHB-800]
MYSWAILLAQIMLIWLGIQVFLSLIFLWYLRFEKPKVLADEQLPKTVIILSLRGADPFLANCLRSLLNQNYPNYDLKLVVDRQEDPAWQIATQVIQEQGATNVQISSLKIIRQSCSLKCSALIQAISELDESYQVVALVDADTIVHPNWLRELVSPLGHPQIGATTGNRWYVPTGKYWGSLVRYIWNVSAVVQMGLYGIPWGGTLAIKTQVIHQTGILDKWNQAFGEDTLIRSALSKHGLRVKFVPSLLILNQEETKLPSLTYWLKRQLLSSRLYHPLWSAVVGDAVLTVLLPSLVICLLVTAIWTKQWDAVVLSLGCYSSYMVALLLLVLLLETQIQPVIRRNGGPATKLSTATVFKIFIGIPFTQWVYSWSLISSLWMPTVKWRGVTYQVKGPWKIRLLDYRPYHLLDQPSDRKISL